MNVKRGPVAIMPFWLVYNASGQVKLLNANLNQDSGCLVTLDSGTAGMGSCGVDSGWTISVQQSSSSGSTPIGAIVGGVVGGVVVVITVAGVAVYAARRKNAQSKVTSDSEMTTIEDLEKQEPFLANDLPNSEASSTIVDNHSVAASEETTASRSSIDTSAHATCQLYLKYGGNATGSIESVTLQTFGKATWSFEARAKDELSLNIGGEFQPHRKQETLISGF